MIYGIGCDIIKVSRLEKWLKNPALLKRFFHEKELSCDNTSLLRAEHIGGYFAAKEAFSKALGTGIRGFDLKEVFVQKDAQGKPFLFLEGKAKALFEERVKKAVVHLTISHEKEYAIAFVVIEKCSLPVDD